MLYLDLISKFHLDILNFIRNLIHFYYEKKAVIINFIMNLYHFY